MPERSATTLIISAIVVGMLWAILSTRHGGESTSTSSIPVRSDLVPLVTGAEPISEIFTRAGCPVCHTIPGIQGADGRVGPPLILGTTGPQRLKDPAYHGNAQSVHDYIVESVMEPAVFVPTGFPANTMPTWYGAKLSASALEKIASYLEEQRASSEGEPK